MSAAARIAALNKFRGAGSSIRTGAARVLVVYDVPVKAPDVFQIPLVINYGECSCSCAVFRLPHVRTLWDVNPVQNLPVRLGPLCPPLAHGKPALSCPFHHIHCPTKSK